MTATRYLDTNVILRFIAADHETMSPAARHLIQQIETGEESVILTPMILAEVVFTLQRFYKLPKEQISEALGALIQLPDVVMQEQDTCLQALSLYQNHNVSFADAYTAASMLESGHHEIYSWDRDFDRIDGISRFEPALPDS